MGEITENSLCLLEEFHLFKTGHTCLRWYQAPEKVLTSALNVTTLSENEPQNISEDRATWLQSILFFNGLFFLVSKLQSLYIISIQEQNTLIWVMYIFNEWIFAYVIKLFICFYSEDYLRVFGRRVYSFWTPIKEVRNDIQWTSDWLTYSKTCRHAAKF